MQKILIALFNFLMICLFFSTASGKDLNWDELNAKVTGHYQQQQFTTAAGYADEALTLARKSGTPDQLAISLNNMAKLNIHLGHFGEAEALSKESLSVRQKEYGLNDPKVAVAWDGLGLIYYFVKKMDDAEQCFLESLKIQEKAHGPKSEEIIPSLKKLENFYTKIEKQQDADKVAARIQAIQTGPE